MGLNGLRYIAILSVLCLAGASAYNNVQHVYRLGAGIILIVVGAELFKVIALPIAANYWDEEKPFKCGITVFTWLGILVFSLVNTFGNTLTRRAELIASIEHNQANASRPIATIIREIADLPPTDCTPQTEQRKSKVGSGKERKTVWEIVNKPLPATCAKRDALNVELSHAQMQAAKQAASNSQVMTDYAKGDAVKDGLVTLAGVFQVYIPRPDATIPVYIVLLWTLMAEIGSAFAALAVPARREHTK